MYGFVHKTGQKPKIPDQTRYQTPKTTSSCGHDTPNTPYIGKSLAYRLFIQ
jgi:hypothetical protein